MLYPSKGYGFQGVLLFICFAAYGLHGVCANDQQKNFDKAWELFVDGQFDSVEFMIDDFINSGSKNRHLHANYTFLTACLIQKTNRQIEARDGFLLARNLYLKLGDHEGIYACDLELAKIYLNQESLGDLEHHLQAALNSSPEDHKQAVLFGLSAKAAILANDYDLSISYFEKSIEKFLNVGDFSGAAQVNLEKARLHMSKGEWELGLEDTYQAQALSAASGDKETFNSTLWNMAAYYEANGLDFAYDGLHQSVNVLEAFGKGRVDWEEPFGDYDHWSPTYVDPPKPPPIPRMTLSPD